MLKPAISAVSSIWFTSFLFSNRKETWINIFPIGMRDSCSKAAPANGYSYLQLVSKVETMKFLFVLCLTGRVDLMGRNLTSWPECFGAEITLGFQQFWGAASGVVCLLQSWSGISVYLIHVAGNTFVPLWVSSVLGRYLTLEKGRVYGSFLDKTKTKNACSFLY